MLVLNDKTKLVGQCSFQIKLVKSIKILIKSIERVGLKIRFASYIRVYAKSIILISFIINYYIWSSTIQ